MSEVKFFVALVLMVVLGACRLEGGQAEPSSLAVELAAADPVIDKACGEYRLVVIHGLNSDEYHIQQYLCPAYEWSSNDWQTQAIAETEKKAREIYERAVIYRDRETEVLATSLNLVGCLVQ